MVLVHHISTAFDKFTLFLLCESVKLLCCLFITSVFKKMDDAYQVRAGCVPGFLILLCYVQYVCVFVSTPRL